SWGIAGNSRAAIFSPVREKWTCISSNEPGLSRRTCGLSVERKCLPAQTPGLAQRLTDRAVVRLALENDRCAAMGARHGKAATDILGLFLHGAPAFRALHSDLIRHDRSLLQTRY